ncbi:MAG: hypothetical protein M0Z95_04105 [Actinomycetota bacterium]|nr:hypothetical protein [Actinomycetota bacterium]
MNEPDGQHVAGYDPDLAETLVAEAADLVRALGFMAPHVVLIGGLVPGLLVPVLDPGIEPHVGTADIDLCLSVALVEGDTEAYERIESVLNSLGFQEGDASFRWQRHGGIALTVEFFCPVSEQRPPGRVFRPALTDNPTGKHNFGGRLSALALDAGELLTTDVEVIHRSIVLPQNKGAIDMDLRVTGPLAFLTAKIDALRGRDKPKDAYDIVWLIESWPGGPSGAAESFAQRPAFSRPEVVAALHAICDAFADTDRIGARSYARFLAADPREEPQLERRAVGAIAEFTAALPIRS